jgi:hypothetical protein
LQPGFAGLFIFVSTITVRAGTLPQCTLSDDNRRCLAISLHGMRAVPCLAHIRKAFCKKLHDASAQKKRRTKNYLGG